MAEMTKSLARSILNGSGYTRHEVEQLCHHFLTDGAGAEAVAFKEIRDWMQHCVSAADEGVDYACPREVLDALTTFRLMEKCGRGKWRPTEQGEALAAQEHANTLPVEVHGKFYEVPIAVQLNIVSMKDQLDARSSVPEGLSRFAGVAQAAMDYAQIVGNDVDFEHARELRDLLAAAPGAARENDHAD